MGLFSCFTGKSNRRQRPRRPSRKMRNRASGRHSGLTVRTSGIATNTDLLSNYGSPTSALSEDDHYQDALEERALSSMSSRSSNGGNTPGARDGGHTDDLDSLSSDREEGLIDKIANWWQKFRNESSPQAAAENEGGLGGAGPFSFFNRAHQGHANGATPVGGTSRDTRAPLSSSPGNTTTGTAGTTAIVEIDDSPALAGCINLFTATQAVVAQRKFLRAIKPKAGSSFTRLSMASSNLTRQESLGAAACAWEAADATTFFVRSKDYMKSKIKEPAGGNIYKLIGVDMYSFDRKLFHIAQHVELPAAPKLGPEALALPQNQRLPPLLIITLQLPTYAPSMFGSMDGAGQSLVYYFALPEGWEPSMVENQAALGLAQRFFNNGVEFDGQPTRDRFKLIPRVVNVDEWAKKGPLSGSEVRLLRSYNGKPLLTRPQHHFYSSAKGQYIEIDIDVHSYAYIARRAFYGYLSRLAPVIFEHAFVLQGNRAEELPEVVLGAVKVYRVDFTKARPFPAQSLEERGNGLDEDGPPSFSTDF
ncbi:hypothetical protein Ndes2526B_g00441 [Nannochloris sp. 'desiccata']|nr:hypothetical protein KSW81_003213 [Chlorella desiccata (nom. nud.)]KAH7625061.1 hypothetical protein NADE_002279 [Chlorella desiccata (nom. nud.)]